MEKKHVFFHCTVVNAPQYSRKSCFHRQHLDDIGSLLQAASVVWSKGYSSEPVVLNEIEDSESRDMFFFADNVQYLISVIGIVTTRGRQRRIGEEWRGCGSADASGKTYQAYMAGEAISSPAKLLTRREKGCGVRRETKSIKESFRRREVVVDDGRNQGSRITRDVALCIVHTVNTPAGAWKNIRTFFYSSPATPGAP